MVHEDFKNASRLADNHSYKLATGEHGEPIQHHIVGNALHNAAATIGQAYGVDKALVEHHKQMAFHHADAKQRAERNAVSPTPTEGPHAPGKGSVLGVPVSYSSGK